jgi:hypothetical protein
VVRDGDVVTDVADVVGVDDVVDELHPAATSTTAAASKPVRR